MHKEMQYIYTMEYYSGQNPIISSTMLETGEREVLNDPTHMWDLKKLNS
jgi:hypothetical protein